MIHIQIDAAYRRGEVEAALKRTVQTTLDHTGSSPESEISVLVTSDEHLQKLNARHRQEDQATDVLSFPAGSSNPESGAIYLGDIAIAYPTAEQQAAQAGHPIEAELQLLAIHGTLHLLGYGHAQAGEKARMWQAQRAILDALGLNISWEHAEKEHS